MNIVKYISIIVFCLLSFSIFGQNEVDSLELKTFWNECVEPLIEKDAKRIEEIVHFPLLGEWGLFMNVNKPEELWTKADFYNNYQNLFNKELIQKIEKLNYQDIIVNSTVYGELELMVNISFQFDLGDTSYNEFAYIFRYKKIDNTWKLYVIQGVG